MRRACITLLSFVFIVDAQTSRTVQANGSATVSAIPTQASVDAGVTTSALTAQEATQQNSTQTEAVTAALIAVVGSARNVQTLYYSVSPRYAPNSSTINGYTVNTTLRATTFDITTIGRLIDAANGAGANTVGGLSFGLREPDPLVQQALGDATKQALAHAAAIASGLGGKLGAVVSAQEGSSYSPVLVGTGSGAAATAVPIQTGTVNVYATVTLVVQLQ